VGNLLPSGADEGNEKDCSVSAEVVNISAGGYHQGMVRL